MKNKQDVIDAPQLDNITQKIITILSSKIHLHIFFTCKYTYLKTNDLKISQYRFIFLDGVKSKYKG